MPELITINYFTDLVHFFLYLILIYYMLYNVVWNKLRTYYYVNLSQVLTKKQNTITHLFFVIQYLNTTISNTINSNLLHVANSLYIQQQVFNYSKVTNIEYNEIKKNIESMNTFFIQNTYTTKLETTDCVTSTKNEVIYSIY